MPGALVAAVIVLCDMAPPGEAPILPRPSVNARSSVRWYRDILYVEGEGSDARKHRMDLYVPAPDQWMPGRPLLVWIHGGGWTIGNKDDGLGLYGRFSRAMAENGIAVANVSYRLTPQVRHPAHAQDVAAAISWLTRHGEALGVSTDAIFISGHSAGGHLAALLGTEDSFLREAGVDPDLVRGVIPSSGVFDLRGLLDTQFGPSSAFARADVERASPITLVDQDDPPFLLIREAHGEYLRHQAADMAQLLAANGVEVKIVDVPQSNHLTMLLDMVDPDGVTVPAMMEFIRERLGPE